MSAAGVRPHARSRYHQTKWQAEEVVRQSGLDWTIFRPSLIYGYDERDRLLKPPAPRAHLARRPRAARFPPAHRRRAAAGPAGLRARSRPLLRRRAGQGRRHRPHLRPSSARRRSPGAQWC
ncbi:MAG: SDR family oxidoreductase [Verrucomicrobiota bacterium]